LGTEDAKPARFRRLVRALLLIAAGMLIVVAWMLGRDLIELAWSSLPNAARRRAAILYLDVLLIGYAVALVAAIGLIAGALAMSKWWRADARRRRRRVRLLALGVAILLSLLALDAGAAAWSAWQQRTPRLPDLPSRSGAGAKTTAGTDEPESGLTRPEGEDAATTAPPAPVPPGALRILVIGESSARGEPYHPWLSVGQIAAWKLESVLAGRPVHVDIWARGGATIRQMHERLADLDYRPDALILYVGHNEFASRFPWMREPGGYYDDDMPSLYSPATLLAALRFSPLCRLVLETWDRQRIDLRPPRKATRELVDQPVCTPEERAAIADEFGRRLAAIAAYCEVIGTLPIFVIPASNDGGYDPNRSMLPPETPRAERTAFAREVQRARALEEPDPDEALRLVRELAGRYPRFAETQYRLAVLLERAGEWDEARRHSIAAREGDGMPLRCPEDLRRAYRDVAARHPAVLLVDGPKVLEAASAHGILDDQLFHDAQHPNLRGYTALARDLLDQVRARRAFGWPEGVATPPVDAEACAGHFGIDARRWEEICRREAWFFDVTAYIRYDPDFRLARADDYRRAGEAIKAGRSPAEAGIPGWGPQPRPSLMSDPSQKSSEKPSKTP
jgi:hypothetical protein